VNILLVHYLETLPHNNGSDDGGESTDETANEEDESN